MYKHRILCVLTLLLSSCQSFTQSRNHSMIISPDSAEAHMLALSQEDIYILEKYYPKVLTKIHNKKQLRVEEVLQLHESGINPDTLIRIMDHTSSHFKLTTSDVIYLQAEGLSYKVINHMIKT